MIIVIILLIMLAVCMKYVKDWQVQETPEERQFNREQRVAAAITYIQVINESYRSGNLEALEGVYTQELYRQELETQKQLLSKG